MPDATFGGFADAAPAGGYAGGEYPLPVLAAARTLGIHVRGGGP
jgi:hypothetical protein